MIRSDLRGLPTIVTEKELFMTRVNIGRQAFFRTLKVRIGSSAMGFFCKGEKLGPTPNTRNSWNSQPRKSVWGRASWWGIGRWKTIKRKHQG